MNSQDHSIIHFVMGPYCINSKVLQKYLFQGSYKIYFKLKTFLNIHVLLFAVCLVRVVFHCIAGGNTLRISLVSLH